MSIDDYLPAEMDRLRKQRDAQLAADQALTKAVADFVPKGLQLYAEAKRYELPFDEDTDTSPVYCFGFYPDDVVTGERNERLYLHSSGHIHSWGVDKDHDRVALVHLRRVIENQTEHGIIMRNGALYWRGRDHVTIEDAEPLEQVAARGLAKLVAEKTYLPY